MVWISKLQTETTLSTMEDEILLWPIVVASVVSCDGLGKVDGVKMKEVVLMHISIHEKNSGALVILKTIPPQFTP